MKQTTHKIILESIFKRAIDFFGLLIPKSANCFLPLPAPKLKSSFNIQTAIYQSMRNKISLFLALILFATTNVFSQTNSGSSQNERVHFSGVIGHTQSAQAMVMVKDVAREQLLKECMFYAGDSLFGFDFGAKCIEADADGAKSYKEFKSFMFQAQTKFIKSKYHISQLPFEKTIAEANETRKAGLAVLRNPANTADKTGITPVVNGACNNLDLETGDFTGWLAASGYNANSNAALTFYGTAYYGINNDIFTCEDLEIISAAYTPDPVGSITKDPNGGNYSARLGGYSWNTYNLDGCYENAYWSPGYYSNGEYIENTFTVNSSNALLSYDYAVVLNDGGHANGEQPYFHVEVTNASGTALSSCTQYYVQAPAGSPPTGFTNSGLTGGSAAGPLYYLPWTSNSINLTPYIGQSVTAKFTAAGCTLGGHPGWAYIDASCGSAGIITSNAAPCSGSNVILTAPAVAGGSYSWSGPGIVGSTTGQTATVNVSGTYFVTVTPYQGAGCAYSLSIPVTFSSMSSSISGSTNVNCFGGNTGSATVLPSGGNPAYTYAWSPSGGNGATGNNLTAGNYTVTVTDAGGCTKTATVAITQPAAALSTTPSQTNLNCFSVCNGTASVIAGGGTPNYTYAWSPSGGASSAASSLCAGNYVVTITDSKGCTKTQSYTITQPTALSNTVSSTLSGCAVNNGTASVSASGGTPGYTYAWPPSGQTTPTATGLAGGTYTVIVTDSKGCSKTSTVNVGNTNAPTVSSTSSTPAGCSVNNGTATANATGGTPNYTYAWSPGGQNTQTANGLAGGTYTCIITDANGCSVSTTVNVGLASSPTTSASSTQSTCTAANGTGTANPSGGTGAYTYSWSPSGQITQTATGLGSGNYSVLVTDANGCTASATISVTSANGPTLTASTLTNVSCNGGNNGTASTSVTGGTPGFTYSWSNGQATSTATGLSAGTYTVTVTDANSCSYVTTTTVTQPTLLASSSTHTNVTCNGSNTGSATINPSGGTPGYTYLWNNGQLTQTATGLIAGSYSVTVTDLNGCTATNTVSITQPTVLAASASSVNAACNGGTTGSATVTPSGGTPGYTYAWLPYGGNASAATNLGAGNYSVTITDANGCSAIQTVSITQPSVLSSTQIQTNVNCNGGNNATATVTPAGGTSPYTFAWSPSGGNAATASNLIAGSYQCTVTDSHGCTTVVPFTITQPTPLTLSSAHINVLCNGGNNGSATVTSSGGTPGYTYLWSPSGGNSATATNLSAGPYQCTVTDSHGCTSVTSAIVTQPQPVTLALSGNDSICLGENTVLSAAVTGGTPAYTYVWLPISSNGSAISVNPTSSTSYSVAVTDANGCTASASQPYNVIVLPAPNALFDTTVAGGTFSASYSFHDLSSGGNSWLWNFGDNTSTSTSQNPFHEFPGAGTYTVTQTVFNQFGCPDTFNITVIIGEGILIPNVFTPDGNGTNDVWYIPNSGMKEFHVEIFDRWGAMVWATTADEIRWDGHSFSGKLLSDGTYYFKLHAILKSGSVGKDYSTTGYVTLLTTKKN